MDFVKIVEKILPPMDALQTWRVTIVIGLGLLGIHAAWAIGWIPGLDGFAQTGQVAEIRKAVEETKKSTEDSVAQIQMTQNTILARIIASDVERAREAQCRAISEKNQAGVQGWRVRLDGSLYEYRVTAGRDYVLRPCDEY